MVLLRLLLLACVHFIDVIMSLSVVFFLFCFPFFFFFLPFSVCLCLSAVKSHISEARCGRFIFFSLHYWLACTSILHFFSAIQFNSTTAITQNAEHTTTDRLNEWVKECVCMCVLLLPLSLCVIIFIFQQLRRNVLGSQRFTSSHESMSLFQCTFSMVCFCSIRF